MSCGRSSVSLPWALRWGSLAGTGGVEGQETLGSYVGFLSVESTDYYREC